MSQRLSVSESVLLVVDIQERLVPGIAGQEAVVQNARRLLEAAGALSVKVIVSEQYPKGLGPTVSSIQSALQSILSENVQRIEKKTFSVCGVRPVWPPEPNVVLCGMEGHICVQQTALDLLELGRRVYLAVDACGSRFPLDYEIALRRMERAGVVLTTCESIMFEWCETADHPAFKTISQIAKNRT